MSTELLRAKFEAWYANRHETYDTTFIYYTPENRYQRPSVDESWSAYQAGRAALQSQHETQLQVWRSTDSCEECWSWDEVDQYEYDRARPDDRRIIQIIKEG